MTTSAIPTTNYQRLKLSQLMLSQTPLQQERRRYRTEEDVRSMADTLQSVGQLQPILVRPNPFPENITGPLPIFEVVYGEGRVEAAKLLGWDDINAEVRELTDDQVDEIQLIENLARKDLHELVEAEGFEQLMKRGHSADEIAERVGKSRRTVYARLQLLKLGEQARAAMREGKLETSIALLLARFDQESQAEALESVLRPGYNGEAMSFRQARDYLHREFTFQLDQAGFDISDAKLVPAAGPCTTCPKRSGNQPELFEDIERADVCTDRACFRQKREAHVALQIKKAKAQGVKIIKGEEAKNVVAWESDDDVMLRGAYVRLDERSYEDGKCRTFAQLIKESGLQITPKLLQTPGGKVVEVLDRAEVVDQLRKAGALEKHKSASRSAPAPKVDPKIEQKKILNRRIFRAIFDKANLSLREAADRLAADFMDGNALTSDVCDALGWDDFNMDRTLKEIEKLSVRDLSRLMAVLPLAEDLSLWGGDSPDLLAEAKRLKIDVKKIEREIADEQKAKSAAAPAKAKASKKKAAKKK